MSLILYPVIIAVAAVVVVLGALICLLDKGVTRREGGKGL
jgi:hypothetical protein